MRKFLPIAFLFCSTSVFSQMDTSYFNSYHQLISVGTVPSYFLESTLDKYNRERAQVNVNQSRQARKAEDDFYLLSNYFGDQLRFSGKVLLNDTIGNYVNRIVDKLLADDPITRAKIHVYTLREPYLNAFATDGGDLFVNIGLVSRLNNEAELAMVLAHEITHYKRRHVLKGYINEVKIDQNKDVKRVDEDDKLVRKHSYSQSLELEADLGGFEMYIKAGYSPDQVMAVFDLLALADYPFANEKISMELLESPYYMIPSCLYLDNPSRVLLQPTPSDGMEESATHPSIDARKKQIQEKIDELKEKGGVANFYPVEAFNFVKTIAQFEEVSLLNTNFSYIESMYSCLVLIKRFPNSVYLKKELLRAHLGYVMLHDRIDMDDRYADAREKKDDYCKGGEFGKFMNYITDASITGVDVEGIVLGMKLHAKYPGDGGITMMLTGLSRELIVYQKHGLENFKVALNADEPWSPSVSNVEYVTPDSLANSESFLSKEDDKTDDAAKFFWKYAIIPYRDDPYFKNLFEQADDFKAKMIIEKEAEKQDRVAHHKKNTQLNSSDTLHMGLSSALVISPEYYYIDVNNGDGLDVKKSIKKQEVLNQAFEESDSILTIDLQLVTQSAIGSNDIQKFNLMMYANEWFDQRLFFQDGDILPFYSDSLQSAAANVNANYITWTAMMSFTRPRENRAALLFTMAYLPIPRTLYYLFSPHHDTYFYSLIYNVNTGEKYAEVFREMPGQHDDNSRIKQNVYDFIYQLNRK